MGIDRLKEMLTKIEEAVKANHFDVLGRPAERIN